MTQEEALLIAGCPAFVTKAITRLYPTNNFQYLKISNLIPKRTNASHLIHISSAGAHIGLGEYLCSKKNEEELVKNSGLKFTILRPGPIAGNKHQPQKSEFKNLSAFFGGLSASFIGEPFYSVRPMDVDILARIIAHVANNSILYEDKILTPKDLWGVAQTEYFYHWTPRFTQSTNRKTNEQSKRT